MQAPHTADIIPFPSRPPADPADRLRHALAALDAALDRQRGAVADWRFSLAAVQHNVQGLGASMTDYHASLGALGRRVDTLHRATLHQIGLPHAE